MRGVGEARITASGAAAKAGDGTAQRVTTVPCDASRLGGSLFSFFSRRRRCRQRCCYLGGRDSSACLGESEAVVVGKRSNEEEKRRGENLVNGGEAVPGGAVGEAKDSGPEAPILRLPSL